MSSGTTRRLLEALNTTSNDDLKEALIEMFEHDKSSTNHEAKLVMKLSEMLAPLSQTKPEHLYSVVRKAIVKVAAFRWVGLNIDAHQLMTQ